jgi:hypothetical protein
MRGITIMELYIQIRNGQPFEHPILGDNFRQAFPKIDVSNLPPEFAKFERILQNVTPEVFEVAEIRYDCLTASSKTCGLSAR